MKKELSKQLSLEKIHGLTEEQMFEVFQAVKEYKVKDEIVDTYYDLIDGDYTKKQKQYFVDNFDLQYLYEEFQHDNYNIWDNLDESSVITNVVNEYIENLANEDDFPNPED